jgi:hypothetical protein
MRHGNRKSGFTLRAKPEFQCIGKNMPGFLEADRKAFFIHFQLGLENMTAGTNFVSFF